MCNNMPTEMEYRKDVFPEPVCTLGYSTFSAFCFSLC
jgi:hypothetical protein